MQLLRDGTSTGELHRFCLGEAMPERRPPKTVLADAFPEVHFPSSLGLCQPQPPTSTPREAMPMLPAEQKRNQ